MKKRVTRDIDTTRIRLDLGSVGRPLEGRVLGLVGAGEDPISGHRGLGDGLGIAAELGPALLVARLSREEGGAVLRGQVSASPESSAFGALVHARGSEGAALAAVDELGSFVLRGWSGHLVAIDLEFEAGAWRVAWPSGDACP